MRSSSISILFSLALVFGSACAGGGSKGGDDGTTPDAGGAQCSTEGATQCDGNTFQTCTGGTWQTTNQCAALCDQAQGCVACQPNATFCMDDNAYSCSGDGSTSTLTEDCMGDQHCSNGACVDLCAEAAGSKSYIGCDYFATDLDNAVEVFGPPNFLLGCSLFTPDAVTQNLMVCASADQTMTAGLCDVPGNTCPTDFTCQALDVCVLDAQHSKFAVVVSNPQAFAVDVTITGAAGQHQSQSVAAGEVKALFPQDLGIPDQSIDNTEVAAKGYEIKANAPIVAYQFNPLDNVAVFSNDGSLLIPVSTYGTSYTALAWPSLERRPDTNDYNGYLTVVATQAATSVTVTTTAGIRGGTGFAALAQGANRTVALDAFQVLNLEAVANGDLTGTTITSDKPIGLFTGHEATAIVEGQTNCCSDHLEEMLFPNSTWGKHYAVARAQMRENAPHDIVRVLAQVDGTSVTVQPSGTCPTLNAGQHCDLNIGGDVEITASNPVAVGHFLESSTVGSILGSTGGVGDPSEAMAVPVEQFRQDYTFLIPADYDAQYISVVAASGSTVSLDSADITTQLATMGSGAFVSGRLPVDAGQHTLVCDAGCSVEVYGFSNAVSYMFAGGLDLTQIVGAPTP